MPPALDRAVETHRPGRISPLRCLHTFANKLFEHLANRYPKYGGLFHLLGEVEVVFGFWAIVLVMVMALMAGGPQAALTYAESRQYTEPLFVFVVMVVAASPAGPCWQAVMSVVSRVARFAAGADAACDGLAGPWRGAAARFGRITEPAAMTIAALMLAPLIFPPHAPERMKYLALGVLFVNVSIGGTLTSYAAPPVLMVASAWQWDTVFMFTHFGWKAALAVMVNATVAVLHPSEPPAPRHRRHRCAGRRMQRVPCGRSARAPSACSPA